MDRLSNFKNGIIVLRTVCEGDGYFWLLPMTGPELEAWWMNQETFWSNSGEEDERLALLFNELPPPTRKDPIPGEFIEAQTLEDVDLWEEMWDSDRYYCCSLCCGESFLRTPDRRYIYHKGYSGNRRVERGDIHGHG